MLDTCNNPKATGRDGKPVGHCFSLWRDYHDGNVVTHHLRLCYRCHGYEKESVATGEIVFYPERSETT